MNKYSVGAVCLAPVLSRKEEERHSRKRNGTSKVLEVERSWSFSGGREGWSAWCRSWDLIYVH